MNKHLKNIIYGALIGASVMIPGLSGGTTALLLGTYYDIMSAVGNIFSKNIKNMVFLSELALGAVIGFYFASFPISILLENYSFEFSYAVIGVLLGSIPVFVDFKEKIKFKSLFFILFGFLFTVYFDKLSYLGNTNASFIFISALLAVALILPGISLTNILIAFGYYDRVINAVKNLEIIFLFKFFGMVIVFVFALSRLIEKGYKKYPEPINMMILGMVLASALQVFPGLPEAKDATACILFILFGIFFSLFICFVSKRTYGE